jgi:ATP-dependent Lhr-like helicase
VRLEPEGTLLGTVNEDWAIESNGGDIFQLGNASWRVLRVETGIVRVADAKGQPPSLPFWLGEAQGRTRELSAALADLREGVAGAETASEYLLTECGATLDEAATAQIAEFVAEGVQVLGTVPTQRRMVLERFFDESGGMQLVVHAPFGSRINRAFGLALRKKFCVGFGFELQAAANEEAVVLSLGVQHSFPLEEVFDYLPPSSARDVLVQALSRRPCSRRAGAGTCSARSCSTARGTGSGCPRPRCACAPRTCSRLAFPQALACPRRCPPGPIPVPEDHPIVRQTIEDCLTEAMDFDGFLEVLRGLRDGSIERVAIDTPEPSAFARGILEAASPTPSWTTRRWRSGAPAP